MLTAHYRQPLDLTAERPAPGEAGRSTASISALRARWRGIARSRRRRHRRTPSLRGAGGRSQHAAGARAAARDCLSRAQQGRGPRGEGAAQGRDLLAGGARAGPAAAAIPSRLAARRGDGRGRSRPMRRSRPDRRAHRGAQGEGLRRGRPHPHRARAKGILLEDGPTARRLAAGGVDAAIVPTFRVRITPLDACVGKWSRMVRDDQAHLSLRHHAARRRADPGRRFRRARTRRRHRAGAGPARHRLHRGRLAGRQPDRRRLLRRAAGAEAARSSSPSA